MQLTESQKQELAQFINVMGYDNDFAMQMAVELAPNSDDMDELKEEIQHYCRPVRETKNARILARLTEIELENE